jgi:hypothetical protein
MPAQGDLATYASQLRPAPAAARYRWYVRLVDAHNYSARNGDQSSFRAAASRPVQRGGPDDLDSGKNASMVLPEKATSSDQKSGIHSSRRSTRMLSKAIKEPNRAQEALVLSRTAPTMIAAKPVSVSPHPKIHGCWEKCVPARLIVPAKRPS